MKTDITGRFPKDYEHRRKLADSDQESDEEFTSKNDQFVKMVENEYKGYIF